MTLGITGHFELDTSLRTPYEIVFSDTSGGRTFVWDRKIEVLKTLSLADISIIEGSRHVYADGTTGLTTLWHWKRLKGMRYQCS